MNKVLECVVTAVDHFVCVSHTSKENTVLRAKIDPDRVYVIPNALDAFQFEPNVSARDPNSVTIVLVSRLVYRKGIDLLVAIIPSLCVTFPQVRFLIGGDGPKRLDLEELRERHGLHDRVQMLGSLTPSQVREVLILGDIFLNTSLTEAFCIALLEAVSCGLLVVSTAVGGVIEVLPPEFIRLSPPCASDLARTLTSAVQEVLRQRNQNLCDLPSQIEVLPNKPMVGSSGIVESVHDRAWRMHRWVSSSYSWQEVALRTEVVYKASLARKPLTFSRLLACLSQRKGMTGPILVVCALVHHVLLLILCWLRPTTFIYKVPHLRWPVDEMKEDNIRSLQKRLP